LYRLASASPRSRVALVSPASTEDLWSDVFGLGGHSVLICPLREPAVVSLMGAATRNFVCCPEPGAEGGRS